MSADGSLSRSGTITTIAREPKRGKRDLHRSVGVVSGSHAGARLGLAPLGPGPVGILLSAEPLGPTPLGLHPV